jgi:hypothetical protein
LKVVVGALPVCGWPVVVGILLGRAQTLAKGRVLEARHGGRRRGTRRRRETMGDGHA